jgi:hypothetical protein
MDTNLDHVGQFQEKVQKLKVISDSPNAALDIARGVFGPRDQGTSVTGYVLDTDGSNENISLNESSNEEIIPALTDLADIIAALVIQLEKRSISSNVCWQKTRAALHQKLSLLADTLPIFPSFGDDCDAQLAMVLKRVRTLVSTLALDVGDTVMVEYDDGVWYEGVVTGGG